MVSLDEAVSARLKRGSKHFEVLVDPEGALAFKRGEEVNLEDVLAVETIFEDAGTGRQSQIFSVLLKLPTHIRLLQ